MLAQRRLRLRRNPGSAREPRQVVAHLGERVVDREQGIPLGVGRMEHRLAGFLLGRGHHLVAHIRQDLCDRLTVIKRAVRGDGGIEAQIRSDPGQQTAQDLGAFLDRPGAFVVDPMLLHVGRMAREIEPQDFPGFHAHDDGNGHLLVAGVEEGLQVVQHDVARTHFRQGASVRFLSPPGQVGNLLLDRAGRGAQELGHAPDRHPRDGQREDGSVEVRAVLAVCGGLRPGRSACSTLEPLDQAVLGAAPAILAHRGGSGLIGRTRSVGARRGHGGRGMGCPAGTRSTGK